MLKLFLQNSYKYFIACIIITSYVLFVSILLDDEEKYCLIDRSMIHTSLQNESTFHKLYLVHDSTRTKLANYN